MILRFDSIVSALRVAGNGTWNRALISQIFTSTKAATICQIPLSLYGASDKIVWMHTRMGSYTVRSGYHLELERAR